MTDYPDCPEGVALFLMEKVLDAEDRDGSKTNHKPREYLFTLYAECLAAANVTFQAEMEAAKTLH